MKPTYRSLEVFPLTSDHVQGCIDLWVTQFKVARASNPNLPEAWLLNTSLLETYLCNHVEKNQGVVAYSKGELVGFMAYDQSMFHGEMTSFSPIIGHASIPESRSTIYRVMYSHISAIWVSSGSLSHMITSYTSDQSLVDTLFHLGFGVYVVDGFRGTKPITSGSSLPVREAKHSDLPEVKRLAEDFRQYFLGSPVFLVTKQQKDEYYTDLLDNPDGVTFVTENNEGLTGFLYVRVNDQPDVYALAAKGVGMIDKLGAFVDEKARGSGAAVELLKAAVDWCGARGLDVIHVDYESANLYGSGFWAKYFPPSLYSLRRKVNQDILD
jgi:GNAT superfamily N-acetyltransferase